LAEAWPDVDPPGTIVFFRTVRTSAASQVPGNRLGVFQVDCAKRLGTFSLWCWFYSVVLGPASVRIHLRCPQPFSLKSIRIFSHSRCIFLLRNMGVLLQPQLLSFLLRLLAWSALFPTCCFVSLLCYLYVGYRDMAVNFGHPHWHPTHSSVKDVFNSTLGVRCKNSSYFVLVSSDNGQLLTASTECSFRNSSPSTYLLALIDATPFPLRQQLAL
jgi:hypothetical protein